MLSFKPHLLEINETNNIHINYVGLNKTPVLVFDFLPEFYNYLIQEVPMGKKDWIPANNFYPGIWAKAPEKFGSALTTFIKPYIEKYLFNHTVDVASIYSCYAMATKQIKDFKGPQQVPHFDSLDPMQIASVLYLCDEDFGGTAFYRHRSTKTEIISLENKDKYIKTIRDEFEALASNSITPCDSLFEKIFETKAKKGRLVIYPSTLFHNGLLNSINNTESDPKLGRLTITSFIQYK
jgi:hypothetical protein